VGASVSTDPTQPTKPMENNMTKSKVDTKALESTEAPAEKSVENLTPDQQAHVIAVECFDTLTALFAADDFQTKGIAGFFFTRGAEYQYQQSVNRLNQLEHDVAMMVENNADQASPSYDRKVAYAKAEQENMKRLGRMKAAAAEAYFVATGDHWTSAPATPKKEVSEADRIAQVLARRAR